MSPRNLSEEPEDEDIVGERDDDLDELDFDREPDPEEEEEEEDEDEADAVLQDWKQELAGDDADMLDDDIGDK